MGLWGIPSPMDSEAPFTEGLEWMMDDGSCLAQRI